MFFNGVRRELEKFFIKKNNFKLSGETYDLILFEPSDEYVADTKYTLSVSAFKFNNTAQRDLVKELLEYLKEKLSFFDYNSISRIKIYNSNDSYVNNLKTLISFSGEEPLELNSIRIGGAQITGYLLNSLLLKKLVSGKHLIFELKDKLHNRYSLKVKIIRIESNYDIVCYTQKALDEIEKRIVTFDLEANMDGLNLENENELINTGFIVKINIDNVENLHSLV